MNYFKHNGKYYFVSRLNGKRSALKQGETLPLRPDARKRYRRETVTEIGPQLVSKNVDLPLLWTCQPYVGSHTVCSLSVCRILRKTSGGDW